MKQVLHNLRSGEIEVAEVPCPRVGAGQLLIRTRHSLISPGTERMLINFGKAGWIEKVRQQPEKVRMVIDKARTDGILPTISAIRNRLEQPMQLGYCNVGVVEERAPDVSEFAVGERVTSNGHHAEMVAVSKNLCAKIPAGVADEEACFTVLGAIALQGIRLVQPSLGETIVVMGLGLVGLLTVQLLQAQGCRVMGFDFDPDRLALARACGASAVDLGMNADPAAAAVEFSRGRGVDAVIICASTSSSDPVRQAARMSRKRGRIVLVGVTGLQLSRADFYEKELTFQVSCSYGPGRYDPNYEEKGQDYPLGFVRWTEQRNFEAVLDMMADGRLKVRHLISHRVDIAAARDAYATIDSGQKSLGVVLDYNNDKVEEHRKRVRTIALHRVASPKSDAPSIGVIGAGNYAGAVLVPAFFTAGVRLTAIASATGVSSAHLGRKFQFGVVTTDPTSILADPGIDIIVVCTRHDTHADYVIRALEAGKHVFVEKPLAISGEELDAIEVAAQHSPRNLLMVGFNRRFAPQVKKIRQLLLAVTGPKTFVMTVNAGVIPEGHWLQDQAVGGGRLVGEACHFIDLLRFLAGSTIDSFTVSAIGAAKDTATIVLRFADGSLGTILYLSAGSKAFPKERLEVFAAGGVLQLDNFCKLRGFAWPKFTKFNLWRQDKGQVACVSDFVKSVKNGGPSPIPLEELLEASRVTVEIAQAAR